MWIDTPAAACCSPCSCRDLSVLLILPSLIIDEVLFPTCCKLRRALCYFVQVPQMGSRYNIHFCSSSCTAMGSSGMVPHQGSQIITNKTNQLPHRS